MRKGIQISSGSSRRTFQKFVGTKELYRLDWTVLDWIVLEVLRNV